MASAFSRRFVDLRPTPKHPAAREKKLSIGTTSKDALSLRTEDVFPVVASLPPKNERSLAVTFIKGINNVTQLAVRRGQAARLGSNLRNLRNYVIFSKWRKLAISSN